MKNALINGWEKACNQVFKLGKIFASFLSLENKYRSLKNRYECVFTKKRCRIHQMMLIRDLGLGVN